MNTIQSFQILRAVAVFLIFLSHCNFIVNIGDTNRLKWLGAAGVSQFIALSGFLAVMKYRSVHISSAQLYKARWRQFWKLHAITLLISIPLTISFLHPNISLEWFVKLFFNLSLNQSLVPKGSVYFSFNAVSWYLSLTIMFALMTPLAVKLYNHLSCKGIIKALILVNA